MADVALLAESEKEMEKVKLFLDAAYPGSGDNVPDPWYGGEKDFEKVFHIIYDACSHIVKRIRRNQLP